LDELLIARIIAGFIRFNYKDKIYLIKHPERHDRYIAEEIYQEALVDASVEGLYTDHEINDMLIEHGIWNDEKEELLEKLNKEIEELKVNLYSRCYRNRYFIWWK